MDVKTKSTFRFPSRNIILPLRIQRTEGSQNLAFLVDPPILLFLDIEEAVVLRTVILYFWVVCYLDIVGIALYYIVLEQIIAMLYRYLQCLLELVGTLEGIHSSMYRFESKINPKA